VSQKDFEFFLTERNFLKVIDTLDKYQERAVDLDSQAGRDFIVFKRQLYQMYEIQNRSVEDHELYSFNIERENLQVLSNAHKTYLSEMRRLNDIEDLRAHANLGDAIFKRKPLAWDRYTGLGYFGAAGLTYAYFPLVAGFLGSNLTMIGMTGATLYGMATFTETNVVNSISLIRDGEHQGKLKINVSNSLISSRNIIADANDVQAVFSHSTSDYEQNDIENNVIFISSFLDNGKPQSDGHFILPAEAWKDFNMLDWVLRPKNPSVQDSTEDLFDDLMKQNFDLKRSTGGITQLQYIFRYRGNEDRIGASNFIDLRIESGNVDSELQRMKETYGEEALKNMTPTELYAAFKKFAASNSA
jgi:hypothetical protein